MQILHVDSSSAKTFWYRSLGWSFAQLILLCLALITNSRIPTGMLGMLMIFGIVGSYRAYKAWQELDKSHSCTLPNGVNEYTCDTCGAFWAHRDRSDWQMIDGPKN